MIDNQDATVQNWKEQLEQMAQYKQNVPITGGSGSYQQPVGNIPAGIYSAPVHYWYRPYQPCPGCGRCPVCGHGGGYFISY